MQLKEKFGQYLVDNSGKVVGAILILVAGFIVARIVGKFLLRWLGRKELALEPPVQMLIVRLVRLLIVLFAAVMAAGTVGINVTAMVAGIGVAGVGVGLAMQGVLSNVVAGLTIIFTKPFRVGEYIEILNVQGQVRAIELFSTTLLHPDHSRVVIPNRKIVGEVLHNYGSIRQLDLTVGVGYGTNIEEALAIVGEILKANPRVLKDPAPGFGIATLADSSINLAIRPWATVADFGPAGAEIYRAVVEKFRANKIEIPFPQREVRLLNPA
jgi:small conductance mechanosensitive channel